MNAGRILVASNSADRREALRAALEPQGHEIAVAASAGETVQGARGDAYDVLILDSWIDGVPAGQLCRAIRLNSNLGIIVLACDETREGRIGTLDAGADDYVSGPGVLAELPARVRAILRRVVRQPDHGRKILLHDRSIDFASHKITGPGDRVIHLTPKEFQVLQCLVANANKPKTHQSLAQTVWQRNASGEVEYMRIVIKQLRRKIELDPDNPRYILTERSVGYRFRYPASDPVTGTAYPA